MRQLSLHLSSTSYRSTSSPFYLRSSPFHARLSSLASRISWRFLLFFARTSKLAFTLTMLSRVASHYGTCALPRVHEKRQLLVAAYLRRAGSTMPSLKIDRSTARSMREMWRRESTCFPAGRPAEDSVWRKSCIEFWLIAGGEKYCQTCFFSHLNVLLFIKYVQIYQLSNPELVAFRYS